MNVTFRPIEDEARAEHHERSRFEAGWDATLTLLSYELGKLGAEAVVIKLALESKDIRLDGWPRANARPARPEVVVEWQSGGAWSRLTSGKYDHWQDNVRAVALTLEALRAVERWGAVEGEQYEGLRLELPSAESKSWAWHFLEEHSGTSIPAYDQPAFERAYRCAARKLHPDAGGAPGEFERLQRARDVLLGEEK